MEDEIKKMLEDEIKAGFGKLDTLETGSKERSTAICDLAALYKLRIEETENERDFTERYNKLVDEAEARERDESLKQSQFDEQVKDRYFKLGIEAAGIILPLVLYAVWMRRGFKFEETGTFTSTTFRGLFNRFRPTK